METVVHMLLMSFFLATPVKGTILPCESPEVEDGHIPVLSCYFSRDVIKHQNTISVYYFTRSGHETVNVLSSLWHNGIAEFFVHPDFSVYGNVTDKVHLQILYDVSRHAGQYQCLITLSDAPQSSHCNFTTSIVPSDTPNGDFTTPFEKSNPKQKHEIITIIGIVFAVLLLFIYIFITWLCCRRTVVLYRKSRESSPESKPLWKNEREKEEKKKRKEIRHLKDLERKLFCKDHFSPSSVASSAVKKWWTSLTGGNKEKHSLNGHLYKELIARFCGPISTVQVPKAILRRMCSVRDRKKTAPVNKTEASTNASAKVQEQYMQIVLSRQQIDCLSLETKCVFLTGPPGAGKTLLLLLKATKWILAGGTVVIICGPGNNPGHFVSHVLINQLKDRLRYLAHPDLVEHVHLETVDAWTDPYTFLDTMKRQHNVDLSKLYFLIDEMWVVDLSAKMKPLIPEMNENVETAKKKLDTLMKQKAFFPAVKTSSVNSTLRDAIKSLKSLDGIHAVSKGIIDLEVQEFLKKLKIDLKKLKIDLKRAPEDTKNVSETLCRSIGNIRFYINAIQSWLASPILMEITKEVYKIAIDEHIGGLWCTGLWPSKCPNNYQMNDLGACIRCPPHVQRLLEQTETLASHLPTMQYSYSSKASLIKPPHPLDCNQPQLLSHANHTQEGPPTEISDCKECGQALAAMLHSTLEDGQWNTKVGFSDILIVGRALLPIPSDSIFIHTLIREQIPVTIMVHGNDDLNDDKHDESVVVTNTFNGHGLERAIVVFVPVIRKCELTSDKDGDVSHCEGLGKKEAREQTSVSSKVDTFANEPWMRRMGEYNQRGLWFVASRCISNLIIIHM